MGLVSTLKSILGLGSDDAGRRRGDGDVTVEREADAGSEHAVKEGSTTTDDGAATTDEGAATTDDADAADESADDGDAEAAAAGTDAAASTGSLVDEEETTEEAAGRAEPAEAAGPESDDESTEVEEAGPDEGGEPQAEGVDVQEVSGIGPAYADRLAEIDIHTVGDLLAADPEDVAERTTVGAGRVRSWQDRAAELED